MREAVNQVTEGLVGSSEGSSEGSHWMALCAILRCSVGGSLESLEPKINIIVTYSI